MNRNYKQLFFACALLLSALCISSGSAFKVLSPPSIAGQYASGSLYLDERKFSFEGVIFPVFPVDACTPVINAASVKGQIAFLVAGNCPGPVKLKNVQDTGAIAVVWADGKSDGGSGGVAYILRTEGMNGVSIPGVEIKFSFPMVEILTKGGNITVSFDNTGSEYDTPTALGNAYAFSIIIGIFSFVNAVLSSKRLIEIIGKKGLFRKDAKWWKRVRFTPDIWCLFLIALASIERIAFCVDPGFTWGIWNYAFDNILLTGSFHISIVATIIILFHFQAAMKYTIFKGKGGDTAIRRMRIPFYVICGIIMAIEIISSFIRGFLYNSSFGILIAITAAIYIAVTGVLVGFYLISASQIVYALNKILKSNKESNSFNNKDAALKRISVLIILCGVCLFLFLIGFFIFVFAVIAVQFGALANWLIWGSISVLALLQILIFSPNLFKNYTKKKVSEVGSNTNEIVSEQYSSKKSEPSPKHSKSAYINSQKDDDDVEYSDDDDEEENENEKKEEEKVQDRSSTQEMISTRASEENV